MNSCNLMMQACCSRQLRPQKTAVRILQKDLKWMCWNSKPSAGWRRAAHGGWDGNLALWMVSREPLTATTDTLAGTFTARTDFTKLHLVLIGTFKAITNLPETMG
jgi:hypothetical protein